MAFPKEVQLLKDLFLLDPAVTYLNHGSFGACPRPVFAAYQAWQCELERQPVEFLGRKATAQMAAARTTLSAFLGAAPDEVVFFPNPTTAVNMVARSLDLQPGDEILATDHEYGALDRTWRFRCRQTGAVYRQQPIPLPLTSPENFIERYWAGVNERTRLLFLSHITSPTALVFPVQEICRRARRAGLLTIVDGAHAPGQIPLNLPQLGADIYTGACHKWLCAPKGSAFLYARREVQQQLAPLVVSWGYESEKPSRSRFIDLHEWQGTRDLAAFLSVPAAIEFQERYDWPAVREACHALARATRQRLNELTGLEPICPDQDASGLGEHRWFVQMFAVCLPAETDLEQLKVRLYEDYHVEAPVILWNGQKLLRISLQGYNDAEDADRLVAALGALL